MKTLKQRVRLWAIAVIVVAGFIVTGCTDGNNTETGVAVTGITLDKNEIYLPVNETETLTATVLPANASDKTLTWSSSKTEVATVEDGDVTAVAEGIAIITVTAKNGRTANCLVIVGTGVESVELNKTTLTLTVGGTETLTVTVLPPNAANKTVTWSSDKPTVAIVTGGLVRAVAEGTATITVITGDGSKRDTCDVTVRANIPGMVLINPGTFLMGSSFSEPENNDDEDLHLVTLTRGFYMGMYEVTQGQYHEVTGFNPSYFKREGQSQDFYNEAYYVDGWKDYPVDYVTWFDAVEFCNKLSVKEGLTPVYTMNNRQPATGYPIDGIQEIDGDYYSVTTVTANWTANGYRLPTEAEWEYACRAGTTTPFNTGNSITSGLDGQANFNGEYSPYNGALEGDYYGYPTPVGSYEPNAWGLYDMHGNMREWCWDWYGSYRETATEDPKGQEGGGWYKVLRGGSFLDKGSNIRSAHRNSEGPGDVYMFTFCQGFRVVRNAQ
jgi:formylglycine-generating enzyme required for sulfatase activity